MPDFSSMVLSTLSPNHVIASEFAENHSGFFTRHVSLLSHDQQQHRSTGPNYHPFFIYHLALAGMEHAPDILAPQCQ